MDPSYGMAPPKYRLPAETRLGTVRLQVGDLRRSSDYYQRVIGLRVMAEGDARMALGVEDGTGPLLELHERAGARRVPRHGRLGLYHFAILLPDRAALGRFIRHLSEIGAPAATADHAVSEAVYLWDPDGLGIEVYADRPRSTWERRGRELYMTTEPLDIRSVIREANEMSAPALPAGTTIGHMHLHVEDLAGAEAFYHSALGFDKVVWSYPGALFLSAGGYHHHLATNTWAAAAPRPDDHEARLLEWEILLPSHEDVIAAARSCESAGHRVNAATETRSVVDPWGTRLRIAAFPSRAG